MRRAVELNPANVIALVWGALVLAIVGDADESVEWLERAHLLDPLSPYVGGLSACSLLILFRDSEALERVAPFLVSNPKHPVALYFAGGAYMRLGQRDKAIEVDCTHMGFAAAPEGILAVGKALDSLARI